MMRYLLSMEQSTFVLIVSFSIIALIAGVCVWVVVKDKRAYRKLHPQLLEWWDRLAEDMGLSWVVPIDHVRKTVAPPALFGKLRRREVYVALQNDAAEEDLRGKWVVVVHLSLGAKPLSREVKRGALRGLKRGRGAVAQVKKKQLVVHRRGLRVGAEWIRGLIEECLDGADQLDGKSAASEGPAS
jgi:hypothetical protein